MVSIAGHPAAREQGVDRLVAGRRHEAVGHRRVDRLDAGRAAAPWPGSSTNAATSSGCVNGARTPANSAQLKIDRNGGTRRTEKTTSRTSGSRLSRLIEYSPARVACALAESKPVAVARGRQAEDREEDERDHDRRAGRPDHRPDVLVGRHAADHRRHEDRRLGHGRHLVAEVGAGDDGAGGDRRVGADQRGERDEGDAERRRGRPRAADGEPDERRRRARSRGRTTSRSAARGRSRRRSGSSRPCSRSRSARRPRAG